MRRSALLRLGALPLAAVLLLTGCSSDPGDEVRSRVEDVIGAANDRDPVAVRLAVDDLLQTLRDQTASKDLTPQEAAAVANAARAVAQSAGLLETATPSPSPSVVETTEAPEPTEEPVETEEPSPTPEPEETEDAPSPTPRPAETTPPPIVEVSPAVVQTQSAPAPSPSPATAQQVQSSPQPSAAPA